MRQFLEMQGAFGLVCELTGTLRGRRFVQDFGLLNGYEIYATVALLVLSFTAGSWRPG